MSVLMCLGRFLVGGGGEGTCAKWRELRRNFADAPPPPQLELVLVLSAARTHSVPVCNLFSLTSTFSAEIVVPTTHLGAVVVGRTEA